MAVGIWTKSFPFLALWKDELSHLVRIISKIFHDIAYFLFPIGIAILAFANAFYLLGKNQVQFDDIEPELYPPYHQLLGAIKYSCLVSLGEFSPDAALFDLGSKPSHSGALGFIFTLATFVLCIHLLNMLIAIMGATFAENSDAADENRMRERLRVVMANWSNRAFADWERKRIKYLVTAFLDEEDEEDIEILKELQESVNEMK